ncbi:hypothetical protein RGUI_0919 [Rhodovulum sp. P5]|nr:hypothetical protein RGUI_0919 [Rhodovulum sp. P5]
MGGGQRDDCRANYGRKYSRLAHDTRFPVGLFCLNSMAYFFVCSKNGLQHAIIETGAGPFQRLQPNVPATRHKTGGLT